MFRRSARIGAPARDLPRPLRVGALAALWLSVLPLLLNLPATVAAPVWLLPGAASVLALYRRVGRAALVGVTGVCVLAILALQIGGRDIRHTGLGLLVAAILMKGAEMRTTRDGYSTVGFVLIGPFVALVMEMGGMWTPLAAGVSLAMAFALMGMIAEWQDRLAFHSWAFHLRRVGMLAVLALPIAAAGFWLVPRLDSPLWGLRGPEEAATGVGDSMSPGDVGNLMKNPATAFRVDFSGARPSASGMYWKGLTLDRFDGRAWTRSSPPTTLAAVAVPDAGAARWAYRLTLEPTGNTHLFVLDRLVSPAPPGTQSMDDGTLASRRAVDRALRLEGLVAQASTGGDGAVLGPQERAQFTQLPEGFNPKAAALAQGWRTQGLSDGQIVRRALDLFSKDFAYSLRPPLLGRNSVDEFVFDTKVGFCEHYSSAFAVLMRAAGVPARVVVGYHGGISNEFGGYWRVRQADAHAWNEVWLDGRGWVRVDPTSALSGEIPASEGQSLSMLGSMGVNGNLADWMGVQWNVMFQDFDAYRQREILREMGLGDLHPALAGALAGLVLALVFLAIAVAMVRERRERLPAELVAWRKLLVRLERAGYAPARHETPLALARRVALLLPQACDGAALVDAAQAFCRWRYHGLDTPGLADRIGRLTLPRRKSQAR